MSRYYRPTSTGFAYPVWSRAVKILIIACVITWLVQHVMDPNFSEQFGLKPYAVLHSFKIWQLFTYIFLHATGGISHILFNMLGLWMFGSDVEREWGTRHFTKFFFVCGIGAGLLMMLMSPNNMDTTIGASGSIYGVLLAYAMLFPERIIILIIFPMPAKYFAMLMGFIAFYSSWTSGLHSNVAHIAHLGGMLCGFVFIKMRGLHPGRKQRHGYANPITALKAWYAQWQRNRLRKKFEVYYNEKHEDNQKWRRWKN